MASRLADEGYAVLLPNIFYRSGKPPIFNFPFKIGDERFINRMNEIRGRSRPTRWTAIFPRMSIFSRSSRVSRERPLAPSASVSPGKWYCAPLPARSEQIAAAASFHGGGLYTDTPASPHTLPRIKAHLYFGHGRGCRSRRRWWIADSCSTGDSIPICEACSLISRPV